MTNTATLCTCAGGSPAELQRARALSAVYSQNWSRITYIAVPRVVGTTHVTCVLTCYTQCTVLSRGVVVCAMAFTSHIRLYITLRLVLARAFRAGVLIKPYFKDARSASDPDSRCCQVKSRINSVNKSQPCNGK